MSSTFTGLQIGKSGLFSAMSALQVTGNNISNVNSEGYTRQKVDTIALGAYNSSMRYCTNPSNYKGLGVRIMGTSQYRDASLDVRYRQEAAKLSQRTAVDEGLTELGGVFDDAINTVLDTQLSNLVTQLQTYAGDPTSQVAENLVKSASEVMTQFFNQYSSRVDTAEKDITASFNDAVGQVNSILEQLGSLNDSIRNAQLGEYDALELQDKRNVLLDELSQYMNIQVTPVTVPVGSGQTVETMRVDFVDEAGVSHNLVNGGKYQQISATNVDGKIGVSLSQSVGPVYDITDTLYNGALKGYIDVLDGKGTYANTTPPADENSFQGIPYYRQMLDTLANKFASIMNDANGGTKPLFQAANGETTITAGNIQIADAWRSATGHYLTNTLKVNTATISYDTDNTNILYMISQLNGKHVSNADGDDGFDIGNSANFNGSLQDFLTNISTTLGTQIEANDTIADTLKQNLDDVEYAREAVTGVNLDEEAVNMITYNYALTAASRFLTTVDEALQTLINGTGMVGR